MEKSLKLLTVYQNSKKYSEGKTKVSKSKKEQEEKTSTKILAKFSRSIKIQEICGAVNNYRVSVRVTSGG